MRCRIASFCILFTLCSSLSSSSAHEPGEAEEPAPAGLTAPVLIERVAPDYPEAARHSGQGGVVGLEIAVGADGLVTDVKVTRTAGFGFDEVAVAAARRFKFKPATRAGENIPSTVLFDQQFVVRPHLTAETSAELAPAEDAPTPRVVEEPAPEKTSTKYESTVSARGPSSAASASTIRNQDFDLRPKTSPNDILRVVPGLLAVQHQGGGKADQIFLRGFDADHGTDVGIFVDGVPINMGSHAHGQGYADLHFLIPEALERVDVVKGPYDVRFGDFSTAGAVNLITREKFDSSSVKYTMGMLPTIGGRTVAQGRFVAIVSPKLTGWAAKLHPWVAFEAAYDEGPFTANENLKRYNLFSKISYDFTPRFKMGVFFQAYGGGWVGSGQIPARDVGRIGQFGAEDPSEGGQTQRQMFTAFAKYSGGDQELEATAYVTRYKLALFNDFTFFLQKPVVGDEIEQDDSRIFAGGKIAYHFHKRKHGISLRTTIGVETRYDTIHIDRFQAESQNGDFRKRLGRIDDTDAQNGFGGNNDDVGILNVGAYMEEDVVFNRYFRLIGALRADFYGFTVDDKSEQLGQGKPNTSGTREFAPLSPKLTAVITPIPKYLDLYLNFGMGYHTNQAEVALRDGQTITNSDGSSYKIRAVPRFYGAEIGARTRLFERLDLAAAFWFSYLENETKFDADVAQFEPGAPTRRLGFDLEVRAKVTSWLFADLDLAQAQSTAVANGGNGGAVALAPKIYLTGGLTAKTKFGLRGGLRFRYVGDRPAFNESSPEYQYFTHKTINGKPNPDYDPSRVTAQGYFIMDAYASYRWRWMEFSAAVQNLLNTTWREAQFGNSSCTYDETYNPRNPNYTGSGGQLSDGRYVSRCGIGYQVTAAAGGANTRSGVTDVHFTPGVPINLQLTAKAYF
ncbi:MAG: TonB family protein [Polyangia bacterium]